MMKKSFVTQRFKSLLFVGTLSMLVEYLVFLSDNIITGNLLGEKALSAITLLSPFFNFTVFVSFLISMGTAIHISYETGQGRQKEANQFFGQGVILAAAAGVILTVVFLLVRYGGALDLFDVSSEISGYMRQYFTYMCFLPIAITLNSILYNVVMTDGGEKLCAAASVVNVLTNVALSLILCGAIGIGGIALGTVISNAVQVILLLTHFTGKRKTLRFVFHVSAEKVAKVLKFSLNDAGSFLFLAIMQFVMNLFLLKRFGEASIVVFTVIMSLIMMMLTCFDGVGQAILPLINVYRGEDSQKSIAKTMRAANRTALIEGLAVTVLLLALADYIPLIFGIGDPALISLTANAVRVYSIAPVFFSFTMLYTSYYLYTDKVWLAFGITMTALFICPVVLGVVMGVLFGLSGIWTGLALSGVVTAVGAAWFLKRNDPSKSFPLLLDKEKLARELSYDVAKTKDCITELIYRVETDLGELHVDKKKIIRIMLMIEETQMLALGGGDNKGSFIECNIILDDRITVILRDSGKSGDYTQADGSGAFSASTLSRNMIAMNKERQYILTGGKNRMIFKF